MLYGYYQPYWLNADELEHHGIKGQKWGVRRYQNPDGTLTSAGKVRYGSQDSITGYISNQNLKVSHELYEEQAKKNVDFIVAIWNAAFDDPTPGALKVAEDLTGIRLEKLPETAKDMDPIFDYAYKEAAEQLYANMSEEKVAAIIAYEALVQAGIEGYFNIGFKNVGGKKRVVYVSISDGTVCETISSARAYAKSKGRRSREKNISGSKVTVKKRAKVSSKKVGAS